MRILVVGSGGREHALVWKIGQSPLVKKIFCSPGNPGIRKHAECVDIPVDDIENLKKFALKESIDLTVVGPEKPLVDGITDSFQEAGLKVFGPSKEGARIEGSKAFAKEIMKEEGVPTGRFKVFDDRDKCRDYLESSAIAPIVVKADGLAAGKGVIIAHTLEEAKKAVDDMMVKEVFGEAGSKVVIEEYLQGPEVSILAFCDGDNILPMISAQDHKKAYDGDRGPNTGGMGAFSPSPHYTPKVHEAVLRKIFTPVLRGLKKRGILYRGILYAGLILTKEGPKVLEFNCRFGDPETQAVLKCLQSDLVEVMLAVCEGRLQEVKMDWISGSAVCVVLASGGYPGSYEKGKSISGLEEAEKEAVVFHAGTAEGENGKIVTAGGRVLGVTASGRDLREASDKAYAAAEKIEFENMHFRRDIGRGDHFERRH